MNKYDFAYSFLALKQTHQSQAYLDIVHLYRAGEISNHDMGFLTGQRYREAVRSSLLIATKDARQEHLMAFSDEAPLTHYDALIETLETSQGGQDFLRGWNQGFEQGE